MSSSGCHRTPMCSRTTEPMITTPTSTLTIAALPIWRVGRREYQLRVEVWHQFLPRECGVLVERPRFKLQQLFPESSERYCRERRRPKAVCERQSIRDLVWRADQKGQVLLLCRLRRHSFGHPVALFSQPADSAVPKCGDRKPGQCQPRIGAFL